MKSLTLVFALLFSFNSFSQNSDNPYEGRGKSLPKIYDYETGEKRKERENRKLVDELKPKDLSNQFSPVFDEHLINKVRNAGNDDLIALAIRKEYVSNARDLFRGIAFHSFILVVTIGFLITYNLKNRHGKTSLLFNISWFTVCIIIGSLFGETINDKLFLLTSNLLNFLLYGLVYGILVASFYMFLNKQHKMNLSQQRVILSGYMILFIFGLGYLTGGHFNEYFYSLENHIFNLIGLLLSFSLFGYIFFRNEKQPNNIL